MTPDHFNALLEFLGGLMVWANVWAVWRDKKVAGIRWWTVSFFALWGFWNLYYYPHLDQWWSLAAASFIAAANVAWCALLIAYSRRQP